MKKSNLSKGFTLVELLVVIAIIGVLVTVVAAAIRQAKDKANDSNIKGNLDSIRAQAELYFDSVGNAYATSTVNNDCDDAGSLFADATIQNAINSSELSSGQSATCYAAPTAWSISVPLKTDPDSNWCVDNQGYAGVTADAIVSTVCD